MTLRTLAQQFLGDASLVTFVNVTRADAGQVTLTQSQLGAARIIDDGTTTRFAFGATRITATADTGPLQVNINGGDISVTAAVDRSTIQAGERVRLSARVRFSPPGASLRFVWDFNDGTPPRSGQFVDHVYKFGGPYSARVTVTGTGGSTGRCSTSCVGHDDVEINVGDPPPEPPPTPGGGSAGGTGGGGAAGSGSGTGSGGSGGGAGTGTDPAGTPQPPAAPEPEPEPKPAPKPKPKKPFGVTISGVLINDPGTTIKKLPSGTAAGDPRGRRESADTDADAGVALPLGVGLALALLMLGALRERRGVKLRLA